MLWNRLLVLIYICIKNSLPPLPPQDPKDGSDGMDMNQEVRMCTRNECVYLFINKCLMPWLSSG